jgi:AcrR family transcriptional regulator
MTPQQSNRQALLDGALRCIEEKDYADVTTRDIAKAANANVASIPYHFGSKDALIAEALAEGFRRWLAEFMIEASKATSENPGDRLRAALETLELRLNRRRGLARAFVSALSRAVHHPDLQQVLAGAFEEMRVGMSSFLDVDGDGLGRLRASVLIAMFDGLLIQWLLDPGQGEKTLQGLPKLLDQVPEGVFGPGW